MPEIKQYINLEADPNEPSLGRTKKIKVQMENKIATPVYIFLESDPGNKDPEKLKADNRAGIDASNIKKTMTISGLDSSITFDLVLSNYGGDKFKVKASTDPEGKKDVKEITDTYVVWKKLFYQLSSMKQDFKFSLEKVTTEYKNHFIEFEETSSIIVPHKENLETNELKDYRAHFLKKKTPYEMHIVLIDRQCDSSAMYFNHTMTANVNTLPYPQKAWPFADWLVEAKSSVSGADFVSGKISVKQVAGGLEVDVTSLGGDPTKVEVDIEIKTLKGEYTGDASFPPHVFIAVGKARSEESKSKTVAHEIGHGIGMVPSTGHALHYENRNGGMGNHCRHGADQTDVSAAQGGAFKGVYTNGTCVMFAFSSEHYSYCDTCKEFVKEATLYKSSMEARKWG